MQGASLGVLFAWGMALAPPTPSVRAVDVEPLDGPVCARFPDDLPGTERVVLLAFRREDAHALSALWRSTQSWEKERPALHVVQAPVIGDVNVVLRTIILTAQRATLPKDEQRRYYPRFVDRGGTARALGVREDQLAAVVVARSGEVCRIVVGDGGDKQVEALRAALDVCRTAASPSTGAAATTAAPPASSP